jgi:hypothetical protein
MSSRFLYAIIGAVVVALTNVLINLISAAIQQRAFSSQFSDQALWVLGALILVGLLLGYWLGGKIQVPSSSPSQPVSPATAKPDVVTITRLRALFSYSKLKGKGIHLTDILLVGSRIDIET